MDRILFTVFAIPVTALNLALALAGLVCLLLVLGLALGARARQREAMAAAQRQADLQEKIAELARSHAEVTGRLRSMGEILGSRQADLARIVAEQLDSVGARVGRSLEDQSRSANESLGKLNERLAVIDAAQARLTGLTEEVIGLKDILANKQARGAFGQGRMEAIVRDALPQNAYEFQYTLSNHGRPDCVIRLPGDERVMVIDAKFPLEAFLALKEAADAETRKAAAARVRGDVGRHIADIKERYFIPGETQDIAILFVPSESLYADIAEHFEDVVQKAHKNRIVIVSPSLLVMAVQVMQALVRDARVREQAHVIQIEVRRLVEDVARLRQRVGKLGAHFGQVQEDVSGIVISADKIAKSGERIEMLDFGQPEAGTEAGLALGRVGKAAE
ncbi:MAG: DNA recombination protein RmuC [Methylovirgula sp.]|nr:DNA recombination protein RmuC [Methylovirgula sp.]